jgi:hypothetical protein
VISATVDLADPAIAGDVRGQAWDPGSGGWR